MGYHRAGFEVVGVDIKPQPHYPFEFYQDDALSYLKKMGAWGFSAIHASPPCQAHSTIAKQQRTRRHYDHPDLVAPTRDALRATGLPWVMENVQGAPMTNCVTLCGSSFGLDLRRHRLFELGRFDPLMAPPCAHHWQTPRFITLDKRRYMKASSAVPVHGTRQIASVVGVHGHINYAGEQELRKAAMGIDWMNPYELTQAIPPSYTEWIGTHLLNAIRAAA
jgi:DNA (cytosine-5)-methyltransferase 1